MADLDSTVEAKDYGVGTPQTVPPSPVKGADQLDFGMRHRLGRVFQQDGRTVMLGLQNEREWKVFCEKVLLQPALADDPRFSSNARRNEHRAALRSIILEAFGKMDAGQVIARVEQAQIANARVNTVGDLWSHPQLQARDRFREVGSPAGTLQVLLPPGRSNSFEPRMDPVPALGQHSRAILAELGYGEGDIDRLAEDGCI